MVIEPIGLLTLLACFAIVRAGPNTGIYILLPSMLFGAAAAIKLPALGGASIQPAYLLLGAYVFAVMGRTGGIAGILRAMAYPNFAFWFALFAAFSTITAIFLPRIFANQIEVFSIARSETGLSKTIILSTLRPSSGNITQTVYLIGDAVLLAAVTVHARLAGLETIIRAILIAAGLNVLLGYADLFAYWSGNVTALDIIRNANYGILAEVEINGVKRVIGSFPEASVYGATSLVFLAFCTELWLRGLAPATTFALAMLSLAGVFLALSSSAFFGLGAYFLLLWLRCTWKVSVGKAARQEMAVFLGGPVVALTTVLLLALMPLMAERIADISDRLLFEKFDTASGIERSLWNEYGMKALWDSYLLGAGAGSIRTSSFTIAVLANTGIIGFALMSMYLLGMARAGLAPAANGGYGAYAAAAGWAMIANLTVAAVAGGSMDLGLAFFVFSGVLAAAAAPVARRKPRAAAIHGNNYSYG